MGVDDGVGVRTTTTVGTCDAVRVLVAVLLSPSEADTVPAPVRDPASAFVPVSPTTVGVSNTAVAESIPEHDPVTDGASLGVGARLTVTGRRLAEGDSVAENETRGAGLRERVGEGEPAAVAEDERGLLSVAETTARAVVDTERLRLTIGRRVGVRVSEGVAVGAAGGESVAKRQVLVRVSVCPTVGGGVGGGGVREVVPRRVADGVSRGEQLWLRRREAEGVRGAEAGAVHVTVREGASVAVGALGV